MKTLKHYLMSENANGLYKREASSSIGLTKEIADKINEIIDFVNNMNLEHLAKEQEQDGRISKGILFMKDNLLNSLRDLFELYEQGGKFTEIYGGQLAEVNKLLEGLNVVITPEMYGAKGDGINDDTKPLLDMFSDVEKIVKTKEFINETNCKDYSLINFKFSGVYKISNPIVFENTYGLSLNNLKLVASNNFIGESMLVLKSVTRNFRSVNLTLNGNFTVDRCLSINGYTLTINILNAEINHFRKYGIYADGKGHELLFNNVRINQYEWGEKQALNPLNDGVGIYLGEERHDNHFTQLVVSYCNKYGIEVFGGTTFFNNSHFYSCEIMNKGKYNKYNNCYFDNANFKTESFFTLTDCILLKSGEDVSPFIYLINNTDETAWRYETSVLNNNVFKAEKQVAKAIDLGTLTELPLFNTISNTFYYVTPFTSHGRLGNTRNPWDKERKSYGDETSGYKIYGNLAIVWGEITGNGFVYYPDNLELSHTIHISFERKDNANPNLIPWANDIKPNRFWANSIGAESTCKWVVIGIVE